MYEKREVQREKLVKAACELAAENGIGALRTRDIAAKAGVCVGTLHYCFETKAELLRALYQYVRAEFRASFDRHMPEEGSSIATLSAATRARIHLLETQTPAFRTWRAFTREAWTNETVREIVKAHFAEQRALLESILTKQRQSGDIAGPAVASPRMAAALLVSIYEGLAVQWTLDPGAFELDEYARAIAALYGAEREPTGAEQDR
jgi:AcrR family transcriptional regulator